MFALATGGFEAKDHGLTVRALVEHVRTMTCALDRLERDGYSFGERRVDIFTAAERAAIGDRVAEALPDLRVARRALEHPYYPGGVRYMLWVTSPGGEEVPIIDGGAFDWLRQLMANRKSVFVASGMGAQLAPTLFRKAPATTRSVNR